jgi:TonB family protein
MKQKIKIMKHSTDVSDEEIRSYMNFDVLLANSIKAKTAGRVKRIAAITFSLILLTGLSAWFVHTVRAPEQKAEKSVQTDPRAPGEKVAPPLIIEPEENAEEKKSPKSNRSVADKIQRAPGKKEKTTDEKLSQAKDVYLQAEPIDGYAALYEYFNTHLNYPEGAIPDSIQGVETVAFTINRDGRPEKITIRQSLGKLFDDEAIRLINTMPHWKPATLNGEPIASQLSIPLTFRLERIKSKRP